jgi:hypothetical protein
MRIEIWMVIITAGILVNTYYNGFMWKWVQKQKKTIQMVGIVMMSFSIYLMIKRDPEKARVALLQATNYVKYMPVNRSTVDQFSNIFDFTTVNESSPPITFSEGQLHGMGAAGAGATVGAGSTNTKTTKRVVSETKKKYVASMQDWKCGNCHNQLSAWFEVDHKKRLEYGGTNNVDNLVALCRECHGQKTAMENM